jgi:LCP family protein required for cell wall assembly
MIKKTKINIKKGDSLKNKKSHRSRRFKAWGWLLLIMVISFVIALPIWKILEAYTKVVVGNTDTSLWGTINQGIKVIKNDPLRGEKQDRINFLILGMRGADDIEHGGLLTDTIMVVSYKPSTKETAMISVPRDLYVRIPGQGKQIYKINSVHAMGEQKNKQGIEYMRKTVASVVNLPIHYVVRVDMAAFKDTVEMLGGIDVTLDKPFTENKQFGKYKFYLPAGKNHLDGDTAFYYIQSRFSTSDFDRARRQQEVITAIKEKALQQGILTDPTKLGQTLTILEKHVRTDIQPWEITKLAKIVKDIDLAKTIHLVYDDRPGGYLFSTYVEQLYALRPIGNDFTRMQNAANNIFTDQTLQTNQAGQTTQAPVSGN